MGRPEIIFQLVFGLFWTPHALINYTFLSLWKVLNWAHPNMGRENHFLKTITWRPEWQPGMLLLTKLSMNHGNGTTNVLDAKETRVSSFKVNVCNVYNQNKLLNIWSFYVHDDYRLCSVQMLIICVLIPRVRMLQSCLDTAVPECNRRVGFVK
jgi:hypothetical protein